MHDQADAAVAGFDVVEMLLGLEIDRQTGVQHVDPVDVALGAASADRGGLLGFITR